MSHKTFVDSDGNELSNLADLIADRSSNPFTTLEDTVEHNGHYVIIQTRKSGLMHGFKTTLTCDDNACTYHGIIRDMDIETEAVSLHNTIVSDVGSDESIDDPNIDDEDEIIIIEE